VTVWNLYHPRTEKRITINFVEGDFGEEWLYKKNPVVGNIVEIELDRK
jgi:hypothetical protein